MPEIESSTVPEAHGVAMSAIDRRLRRIRKQMRSRSVSLPAVEHVGEAMWRREMRRESGGVSSLPRTIEIHPGEVALALPAQSIPVADEQHLVGSSWERYSVRIEDGSQRLDGAALLDPEGPPTVAIGRTGSLFAVRGATQFSAGPVTAEVAFRHPTWARFASEVRGYAKSRGGNAYQPYLHPDLRDIPHDHGHERFELLKAKLPLDRGRVLDIGANSGYFCHRLEDLGFQCVAVERSVKEHYILKGYRDSLQRTFLIEHCAMEDLDPTRRYDLVLAFNIFHHFLKKQQSFDALVGFLRRLRTDWMVIEVHRDGERQLEGAEVPMTPLELIERVAQEAGLTSMESIGEEDGRPIYLLGKE